MSAGPACFRDPVAAWAPLESFGSQDATFPPYRRDSDGRARSGYGQWAVRGSMTSAADLFTLQDIDLRRDSRRALIADIDLRLGETHAVIAAREAVATATAIRQSRQQEQRQIETQLEDLDAKTRPLEAKLYDGSVRNPKELADMQHEVEGLKEPSARPR